MIDLRPEKILDIRTLSKSVEILAYRDGGLFPVLATASDGSAVAVLRGGAGHLGLTGRIDLIRSYDGGLNWSPPNILANSERDDRNPAFGVSRDGTLILAYHSTGVYDAEGNYDSQIYDREDTPPVEIRTMRSLDAGFTWEAPSPLTIPSLLTASPYGKIVQRKDGTLLMGIYGYPVVDIIGEERFASIQPKANCAYLVRSYDDGKTWQDATLIAVGLNETGLLVLPDDSLFAVIRSEGKEAMFSTRSQDGGFTWSEPVQITNAAEHPADLLLLGDGSILLTYGNRNADAYRIEGRISRDGGRSWLDLLLVFSGKLNGYDPVGAAWAEFGYPTSTLCPAVHRGAGMTMYYVHPAFPKTTDWSKKGCPQAYSPQGYMAVAVLWDEDELLGAVRQALG